MFLFLCVCFVGGLIYVFVFSSLVHVVDISVSGATRVDAEDVRTKVRAQLEGEFMPYIARRNYFFLNRDAIIQSIKTDQRVQSVEIRKKFPDGIDISITEYTVVPVWCIGDMRNACYVLDADGCVVVPTTIDADIVTQNPHFIVVDKGHDTLAPHQCIITGTQLHTIGYLGEELTYAFNTTITQPYVIEYLGSHEVRYNTQDAWYILVDVSHDADAILHTAKLFNNKVDLPGKQADLAYVDLRFVEKIFYKMKDGVEQQEDEKTDVAQQKPQTDSEITDDKKKKDKKKKDKKKKKKK